MAGKIWEESEGFVALIEKMGQVLPGIPETWYMDIMVPVFATTDTLAASWPVQRCDSNCLRRVDALDRP